MNVKLKFLISSLYILVFANMNAFTIENSISKVSTTASENFYNINSNNSGNKEYNKPIESTTNITTTSNNNRNLNIPLSVSNCRKLENIIEKIHNNNTVDEVGTFEQIIKSIYKKVNKNIYQSQNYSNNSTQNEYLTSNSAFALKLAKELTKYAEKLQQYKSIYYAINCYKTLTHLMYIIGKDQNDTEGYSVDIGIVKLHMATQKHITDNEKQEKKLHKYSDKFLPYYNYFLDEVYPKMFEKPIDTSLLFKLGEVLERKSDEINYIRNSLLPQVRHLIHTANKVNANIILLDNNINLFRIYLNELIKTIKNYWISAVNVNEEIINLINTLKSSTNNSKDKIEIDISKCKELVDKVRAQFKNIDRDQWSYSYNLIKYLPDLAMKINSSKDKIIEYNFSLANNLAYISKLIENDKLSDDEKYNEEVNNILEEVKNYNSVLD